ncbi:hypothetical protein K0M31_017705 [Melipona bicolor]|uniref:Uncharacterized protein n=1 Tax=Melipona bicolor TaxID=60889 RepID=A0AA40G5D4_9HYME|nr:hypothetical protein K0M31_017705 [Melipona bicolor]
MRRCPDIEQLRSTILISWITSEDREMLTARDSRRDILDRVITLFQLRVTSLFRKVSKIPKLRSSLTSVLISLTENCDVVVIASAFWATHGESKKAEKCRANSVPRQFLLAIVALTLGKQSGVRIMPGINLSCSATTREICDVLYESTTRNMDVLDGEITELEFDL